MEGEVRVGLPAVAAAVFKPCGEPVGEGLVPYDPAVLRGHLVYHVAREWPGDAVLTLRAGPFDRVGAQQSSQRLVERVRSGESR